MFLFKLTNGKCIRISGHELWQIDNDGLIRNQKATSTARSTNAS
jgi:nuclear transport factor 2 (NTF2) superfamily protein